MITLDLYLKQTHLDGNLGVVDEYLLICTTRWMQERIIYIIGVAYIMKQAIIEKHVLIDNVCMTKQIFVKIYYDIMHTRWQIFFSC